MEKYKEIDGDLLQLFEEGHFENIAHGANCFNIMGAGIAGQIKNKYPQVFYADKYYQVCKGIERLGNLSFVEIEEVQVEAKSIGSTLKFPGVIFNLYTQNNPGPDACYDAVRLSLRKLNSWIEGETVGLPKIGCGIGGLEWDKVKVIIQEELKDCFVTVVNYKK
jgi:O-acetyl-ADP-ribose deacetylase (regulator of RNase III)